MSLPTRLLLRPALASRLPLLIRSVLVSSTPLRRRFLSSTVSRAKTVRPLPLVACVPTSYFQKPSERILTMPRRYFSAGAGPLTRDEVTQRVLNCVKTFEKVQPEKVTEKSNFITDLGLDSLDTVEIVMLIEEEFAIEIPDAEAVKINSVADAINYILANPHAK